MSWENGTTWQTYSMDIEERIISSKKFFQGIFHCSNLGMLLQWFLFEDNYLLPKEEDNLA